MTKCYLILIDDMVVAKRALGTQEDGSMPVPPEDSIEVPFETYRDVTLGSIFINGIYIKKPRLLGHRPDTNQERQLRLIATVANLNKEVTKLKKDITELKKKDSTNGK